MSSGFVYAALAYIVWGVLPAYWKQLQHVPHLEVLAHRIFWAAVFFVLLLLWKNRRQAIHAFRSATSHLPWLTLSAILVSMNWLVYIYAVNTGQVLESSLGYFINPLVNVLLGRIFLGERLAPLQKIAVALAGVGVLQMTFAGTSIPWIALFLAFSFGFYGLIRKRIPIPALASSTVESALLAIPALVYILYLPQGVMTSSTSLNASMVFLILSGAVTALPLLWFAEAAQRLTLSTLGLIQYLAPTMQFSLAVFLYNEPFTGLHARSFACIWAGLALYSIQLIRDAKKARLHARRSPLSTDLSGTASTTDPSF